MIFNWTNITSPIDLMRGANTIGWSYFWTMILYMVFFIILLLLLFQGLEVAVLTASMIALMIGIFLTYMGLVAWTWCLPFVALIIFLMIYTIWLKPSEL